jgi:hypothetical protein
MRARYRPRTAADAPETTRGGIPSRRKASRGGAGAKDHDGQGEQSNDEGQRGARTADPAARRRARREDAVIEERDPHGAVAMAGEFRSWRKQIEIKKEEDRILLSVSVRDHRNFPKLDDRQKLRTGTRPPARRAL